jgi:hypothetical protein
MDNLTEDKKGNIITRAVWHWLQEQKRIEFVPWVLDPSNSSFDALSAARQEQRVRLLSELENVILTAAQELIDAQKGEQ